MSTIAVLTALRKIAKKHPGKAAKAAVYASPLGAAKLGSMGSRKIFKKGKAGTIAKASGKIIDGLFGKAVKVTKKAITEV